MMVLTMLVIVSMQAILANIAPEIIRHEYSYINPVTPEFLKWTLPSLHLVMSMVGNRVLFTQNF